MTNEDYAILKANQRAARGEMKPYYTAELGWTPEGIAEQERRKKEPRRGRQNKLEAAFQREVLEGCVAWFDFEAMKFRLADGAWYTPDFPTQGADGTFTIFEVKGHWREAARVRIKVAADKYPFAFVAVTKDRKTGEWVYERISGRGTA